MALFSPKLKTFFKGPTLIYTIGIIAIGLLFITATGLSVSSNPKFCSFCHEMQADIDAWKSSAHSEVTCYSCHAEPGIINFLKDKITVGLPSAISKITGDYELPINAESKLSEHMESEVCLVCHNENKRKVTTRPGIIMDHQAHEEAHVECLVCHNRVAHPQMVDYPKGELKNHQYIDRMKMVEGCSRCHKPGKEYVAANGKKASSECSACHPANFNLLPKDHMVAKWTEDPSPKSQARHSVKAKQNYDYCYSCHNKETFCNKCHGTEMPHQRNWRKQHSQVASKNTASCRKCHASETFCADCHHKQFYAKITGPWYSEAPGQSKHPEAITKRGTASPCFRCHDASFCARCHIKHLGRLGF